MTYTFMSDCKKHKVNPELWLKYALDNINDTSPESGRGNNWTNYCRKTLLRAYSITMGLVEGLQSILVRMEDIEKLASFGRRELFNVLDAYLRDYRTSKAYAG